MAPLPDGMAGESRRELDNMRRARQEPRTPPWELAALDESGNELYRTEYFESESEARHEANVLNEGGIPDRLPDAVARFEPVKSE